MAQGAPCLQRAWLTDPARAQLERKRCCEAGEWHTTSSCRAVVWASSLGGSSTNAGGNVEGLGTCPAEGVSASACSSNKFFSEDLGSRCPTAWLRDLAGRWDSPFHPWPLWLRYSQVPPATWDGAGQAKMGHFDVAQQWYSPWSTTVPLSCLKWQKEVKVFWLARKKIFHINYGDFFIGDYLQWEGETT